MTKIFCIGLVFILLSYSLVAQNLDSVHKMHSFKSKKSGGVNKGQSIRQTQNYDLTKVLPDGFVKDGSVDYTAYIQKGMDENTNVLMPNFPLLINEKGISVKSNCNIIFKPHSSLLMKPNSLTYYVVLKVFNASNVTIESPVIVGERNQHIGNKGEWGMGLQITASKNIKINSPTISDCWGDGIYIGGDEKNTCDNIKIINAKIDNCRRNGISITDGINIQIIKPVISNMNGALPMSGIDIEPNNNKATIDNILISNPITISNESCGIIISLQQLPTETAKTVRIKIENHIDNQSKIAIYLSSFRGNYENKIALSGLIEVNNPKWYNNTKPLLIENYNPGPMTKFKNVNIFKDGLNSINKPSREKLQELINEQSKHKNITIE